MMNPRFSRLLHPVVWLVSATLLLVVSCERTPSAGSGSANAPGAGTPNASSDASNDPRWSEPALVQSTTSRGVFICPMFCENDYVVGPKTHDTKTICTVCRMDLERVADLKYEVLLHPAKPDANGRAAFAASGVLFRVEVGDPLGAPVKPVTYVPMFGTVSVRASDDSWKGDAQAATLTTQDGRLIVKLVVPKAGRYLVSGSFAPPKESGREPGEFLAAVSIE